MRPLSDEMVAKVLKNARALAAGDDKEHYDEEQIKSAIGFASGRPRRGFEAITMANVMVLSQLSEWLKNPAVGSSETMLKICEDLANKKNAREAQFARKILLDWISEQNRVAATCRVATAEKGRNSKRLASAIRLWETANQLFENTDSYNLDVRGGFIILFDEIANHSRLQSPASA